MIYYKRYTGKLLPQKTAEQPSWVQWTHHSEGKTHCEECLRLDDCWFQKEKAPLCPHHPYCHCTLDRFLIPLLSATLQHIAHTANLTHICLIPEVNIHTGKINCFMNGAIQLWMHFGCKKK